MALPKVGSTVRCERAEPGRGTWKRYAGRVGTVVSLNRADREVGVRFTGSHDEPITWFRPTELAVETGLQPSDRRLRGAKALEAV